MEDDGNRGRSLLGLVVVLAVVAAVGWFARPPGPPDDERNPDELAIDDPPTSPSTAAPPTGPEPTPTPDTFQTPETLRTPETIERTPTGPPPDAFEDLAGMLPVIEGEWRTIEVEVDLGDDGSSDDDDSRVVVWEDDALVVVGRERAGRYDPVARTWQALPSPPAAGPATSRQVVSVGGQVVVLQTQELEEDGPGRKAGYRLDGDTWVDLDIPGGLFLGATDEALVMTRREPGVDGGVNPSDLALVDPTDGTVENLADPPEELVRIRWVIGLGDGFVAFGQGPPTGEGTAEDPIGTGDPVTFRWSPVDGWHPIPHPPDLFRGPITQRPTGGDDAAEGLVAVGTAPTDETFGLATFDLGAEAWSPSSFDVPERYIPFDEDHDRVLIADAIHPVPSGTVWLHVRSAPAREGTVPTDSDALIAWHPETDEFTIADGDGSRVGPSMAWIDGRLILAGGASDGANRQPPLIQEWIPADGGGTATPD